MMLMLSEIIWRPAFAPLHVAAAGLVMAALVAAATVRCWPAGPRRAVAFGVMRLAVIAALCALLMGPSRVPPRHEAPDKPTLCVMLDTSASMQTADADGRPRADYVIERWLRPDQFDKLRDSFDVRLIGFDESLHALTDEQLRRPADKLAVGRVSRYAAAFTEAAITLPESTATTGGVGPTVVILGDGHDTDSAPLGPAAQLAKDRSITVHTISVGRDTSPPDIAVAAFAQQAYLMAGETGQIVVRIFESGMDGRSVNVKLAAPDGQITLHPVRFGDDGAATLNLPITPGEPGRLEYMVSVDPQPGESVTGNNRHAVFVEAIRQRIRVLIVEGQPYWDTKFIAQSLRTDPWVELTHITQVSQTRREGIVTRTERETAVLPRDAEQMSKYDVIVVGSDLEKLMTVAEIAELVAYVEGGGNVVFARGRAYDATTPEGMRAADALAVIEPTTWARGLVYPSDRARFRLTPAGRGSASFSLAGVAADVDALVGKLPNLRVMPLIERVKPGAQVLATLTGAPTNADPAGADAAGAPAIVTMAYGRGRVFAVLGEGLWRWGFLPPALRDLAGVFDAFWSNSVRWLAMGGEFQPGAAVALKADPTSVRLGDPVTVAVATKFKPPIGWSPKLTLTTPDGERRPLTLAPVTGVDTRWQAVLEPDSAGVWSVTLDPGEAGGDSSPPPAPLVARFSVYELDLERLRPAARPRVLAQLAERTGGMALTADSSVDLAAVMQRRLAARLAPPTPQFIWDAGWLLTLLLVWVGLEWLGRRQAGWL